MAEKRAHPARYQIDPTRLIVFGLVVIDAYDYAQINDVSFIDCHAHRVDGGLEKISTYVVDLQATAGIGEKRSHNRPLPAKATVNGVTSREAKTSAAQAQEISGFIRGSTMVAQPFKG